MRGLCPACGRGKIFYAYLKVNDLCPACGEELFHQRADDMPPYVTMVITGHFVVAGIIAGQDFFPNLPDWPQMVFWPIAALLLSLWLLPKVKGALIAYQWALAHARIRTGDAGRPRLRGRQGVSEAKTRPVRPRDAAALILLDGIGRKNPKILLGKRHPALKFMPDKYVFPGGRLEPGDRRMNIAGPLDARVEARLLKGRAGSDPSFARALALAAIRETFEETGHVVGTARLRRPGASARRLARLCRAQMPARSAGAAFHRPRHHPAHAAEAFRHPLLRHRRPRRDRPSSTE